jgi:hypothetical protein
MPFFTRSSRTLSGNIPQSHRKGAQAKVPDYRTVGRFLDPIWSTGYVSEAVDTVTRPVTSVDVLRVSTPEPESAILSGRVVRWWLPERWAFSHP